MLVRLSNNLLENYIGKKLYIEFGRKHWQLGVMIFLSNVLNFKST